MPTGTQSLARANTELKGRNISDFFVMYGMPVDSRTLRDGSVSYRWISLEPAMASSPGYIVSSAGHYAIPQAGGNGQMVSGYCEVRILTDKQDRIRNLTLVNDPIGKFSGSRCGEIFGQ